MPVCVLVAAALGLTTLGTTSMTSASMPSAHSSAIASAYCCRTAAFLADSPPSLSTIDAPSRTLG
eukprot:4389883-Prymnesium_polylepis.1